MMFPLAHWHTYTLTKNWTHFHDCNCSGFGKFPLAFHFSLVSQMRENYGWIKSVNGTSWNMKYEHQIWFFSKHLIFLNNLSWRGWIGSRLFIESNMLCVSSFVIKKGLSFTPIILKRPQCNHLPSQSYQFLLQPTNFVHNPRY